MGVQISPIQFVLNDIVWILSSAEERKTVNFQVVGSIPTESFGLEARIMKNKNKFKVVKLTKEGIPYHKWAIMYDETYFFGPIRYHHYIDSFGITQCFCNDEVWSYYNKKEPMQYTGFHTRDQARRVLKRYQMGETSFLSRIKNGIYRWFSLPLW